MKVALIVLFALTAALYASVGFGGGSTYNALLVLSGADYRIYPIIALACNIAVVSGNTYRFSKAGFLNWQKILPFIALAVPMAWIGGRLNIPEIVFIGLLGASLLFAGISLLLKKGQDSDKTPRHIGWLAYPIGGAIGLISGIVGIGGGIFLAPILHRMNWGGAKAIAAASSLFILVNSISGLLGQFVKLQSQDLLQLAQPYWLLIPAVLIGGWVGNTIGIKKLDPQIVRRLTALLILYVALRLLWKFFNMSLS
ncbi:MAG: sulfite exporter TauE/SafE family protein [Acidimicrobiales bacterium]|nr:sulfite exporter TauE/SafE family protein [Hyphomonadaceae bacterium]RZV41446.1 MAG: sulfite exporter TauE/SafE family protein [Acidimicrobiales bacterium]